MNQGGECSKSVPKNDDRCAQEGSRGIRCFNCGLEGHIQKNCRRGQGKLSLNGIGRTKATPSSNPNLSLL